MNYYNNDVEAEALKLWCYIPSTFLGEATIL